MYWARFIDDVLNFFQGCEKQAERYFDKLNALYPDQVHFTWECSNSKGIFLNIEIFKNENLKIFETKYFVKPSNKRQFLHYSYTIAATILNTFLKVLSIHRQKFP